MNNSETFRAVAKEFAEKIQKLSSIIEIDIVGSVAGNDPCANDLDMALIVRNFDEFEAIAKYARQMGKYFIPWEIFVFDENLKYLGKVCFRRKCPTMSVDCDTPGCGEPRHLRVIYGFQYNERMFLESPIEVLWTTSGESRLLARKKELGIGWSREYPIFQDIKIECIDCGKKFVFTAEEQKWYQKMGFEPPKRCPKCRKRKKFENGRL